MTPEDKKAAEKQARLDLAGAFTRVFTAPDGIRVLRQLKANFCPQGGIRFYDANGKFQACPLTAAFRDGQASVIADIEAAVEHGRLITPPTPTPN